MLAIGLGVLWVLKWIERHIVEDRTAILRLRTAADGPSEASVRELLAADGFRVTSCSVGYAVGTKVHGLEYELRWRSTRHDSHVPQA